MAFTIPNEADAFAAIQAEPDKVDIDILASGDAGNGVTSGCAVSALTPTAAMFVQVAIGSILYGNAPIQVIGGALAIAASDPTNPRFDLICAVSPTGAVSVTKGTAAAKPVFPQIPANSVALAAVLVAANDTTIPANRVTDKRIMLVAPSTTKTADPNASCLTLDTLPRNRNYRYVKGDPRSAFLINQGPGRPVLLKGPQPVDRTAIPSFTGVTITGGAGYPTRTDLREGTLYRDTTTKFLYQYDGVRWIPESYPIGTFGGRMFSHNSNLNVTLVGSTPGLGETFLNGHGIVEINGELIKLASLLLDAGSTIYTHKNTTSLINSLGVETGATAAVSTLYYAYVSNSRASIPNALRLSSTVYSTASDGFRYLGTTGNAANWRFVGMVRTNAAGIYPDSNTQRFIGNYYNRKRRSLFTCPGYVNDNALTTYQTNSTTWTAANAGTGAKLEFLASGEDAVSYHFFGSVSTATQGQFSGLGCQKDGAGGAITASKVQDQSTIAANREQPLSGGDTYVPAEGYRTLELMIVNPAGGFSTYRADQVRDGATADPYATYVEADVWA